MMEVLDSETTAQHVRKIFGSLQFFEFSLPSAWRCAGIPWAKGKSTIQSIGQHFQDKPFEIFFYSGPDQRMLALACKGFELDQIVDGTKDFLDVFLINEDGNIGIYADYWEDIGLILFKSEVESIAISMVPIQKYFDAFVAAYRHLATSNNFDPKYAEKLNSLVNYPTKLGRG